MKFALETLPWNAHAGNNIIYNTEVLKSNLSDYNDAYILVRGDIFTIEHQATQVAFKNCAPFTTCITTTDGKTIDEPEDLHLVMPMYNLIECSLNYSKTTEVYGFILKMKQLISITTLYTLIILHLSSIRLNY